MGSLVAIGNANRFKHCTRITKQSIRKYGGVCFWLRIFWSTSSGIYCDNYWGINGVAVARVKVLMLSHSIRCHVGVRNWSQYCTYMSCDHEIYTITAEDANRPKDPWKML